MAENPWPDLTACEFLIEEPSELEWRQVHPTFEEDAVVSTDAFVGSGDSTREVSTARSATSSAEEAFRFHTEERALQSAGTWAVSVSEAVDADCRCIDDSECEGVETPSHSYIDMRALSKAERTAARVALAAAATDRGRRFP